MSYTTSVRNRLRDYDIVQELLRQGTIQRIPPRGHLTDVTVIRLAEQTGIPEATQPAALFCPTARRQGRSPARNCQALGRTKT
jgi:hypothetical protein